MCCNHIHIIRTVSLLGYRDLCDLKTRAQTNNKKGLGCKLNQAEALMNHGPADDWSVMTSSS